MATAIAAFSVLPVLGYILGSVIIGYLAIRVQKYVRQRRSVAVALPRPVHETVSSKSPLSFARSTGWVWPGWALPVLWSRTPAVSFLKSKAAPASVKNITIELLPTTGLPPPPTSIETPQLVDLSSPPPIPQRVVPTSPERHKAVLSSQTGKSFSRPPSPHAFLATTPPQARHKRSRSLGGVPIRRLSGGLSGLRNKVDVEMHEFMPGHSRDTSREHLLVDFSSSVSEDEGSPESDGNRVRISPTASDIGVIPVSSAFGKVVKPCPMPLVDLGDDGAGLQKSDSEDDHWMWFGPSAPSSIRRYDARSPVPSVEMVSLAGGENFVFPLPQPLPKLENLLFSHSENEKGKFDSLDSSETLVDIENACPEKDHKLPEFREEFLDGGVTVDVIPDLLVNPFDDTYAVDFQSPLSGEQQPSTKLVDVDDHEYEPRVAHFPSSSSPFHHPLEDLVQVDVRPLQISPHTSSLFTESRSRSDLAPILLDGNAELGSPLLADPSPTLSPLVPTDASIQFFATESPWVESLEPMNWPLSELEDLWGDSSQDQVLLSNLASDLATGDLHLEQEVVRTQDMLPEKEYVETSPGGSLLPTLLDGESADEEVPVLNLDLDDLGITEALITQEQEEEEEDTPRPTPASVNAQLPVLDNLSVVPAIFVADDSTENSSESVVLQNEACPDPDFLPLPEILLSSSCESVECKLTDPGLQPSSQMPTPPASPPSTSPIRLSPASPNPTRDKSLPASPRFGPRIVAGEMTKVGFKSRPTSPYPALDPLPFIEAEEKNGQMTPVPRKSLRAAEPAQKVAVGYEEKEVVGEVTAMEVMEIDEDEVHDEKAQGSSLPGSFPGYSEPSSTSNSTSTIAARLATNTGPTRFHPSVRAIVSQPVEIALAMQLRPGLGAGADPAWMVRFLMAMFGWFAVLVSGQENY